MFQILTTTMLKYLFILISFSIHSQSIVILDLKNNEPISYVAIELFEGGNIHYDYSNVDGVFTLPTNKTIDKIRFGCLGYESKEILFKEAKGKIYLTPKITLLKEVVVSSATKFLGNLGNNLKSTYAAGKNHEHCFFIENTIGLESGIKSFQFYMGKLSNKLTYVMRFRLYKKDKYSIFPGETIEVQNNFFEISEKLTGLYKIDLADYNILLPKEGAFISIEIVEVKNKKGNKIGTEEHSKINYEDKLFLYFTYGKEDILYDKKYSFFKVAGKNANKWFECVEGLRINRPDAEYSNFKFILEVFE